MKPIVLVVMTAIVPTKGHQFLVNFAKEFSDDLGADLKVIISRQPGEPTTLDMRAIAFESNEYELILHEADPDLEIPTEENEEKFWKYWVDIVENAVGRPLNAEDHLVASEDYGVRYAKELGCKFIPCDVDRVLLDITGEKVRSDIYYHFDSIAPEFALELNLTATIFGAESCGKTTVTKNLAFAHGKFCYSTAEWAREYLELNGAEITEEKMLDIIKGQAALQTISWELPPRPFIFRDTDLYSTLGYYELWGRKPPDYLEVSARLLMSDVYYIMPDHIPFEPDQLRYGVNRRETTTEWWVDFIRRQLGDKLFNERVVLVPEGDAWEQAEFIDNDIHARFEARVREIEKYARPR